MQAPCKFRASSVHVQRKRIARFCATLLRCTCLRRNLWISYCLHPSCMKTCNTKALHVFMQLGCKNLQVSPSETCTHLVQATCVARDCRRALSLKENLTLTNKKWQPQHTPRKFPKTQSTHPFNNSMDDGDYQEVRATSSRRRRCWGREAMSTCCRRRCPTGGGGLRSEG